MNAVSRQVKYTECLNDLMDYFLIADVSVLSQFKSDNQLSDNLQHEFTTNDSAEQAVRNGVMIPLSDIENYPYTIYFTCKPESAFTQLDSDVQHHQSGYIIKVESRVIHLLTMPLLKSWSKNIDFVKANKPTFSIENGWYQVEVICGETLQESGWEPTIEFILTRAEIQPSYQADIRYRYKVVSKEY